MVITIVIILIGLGAYFFLKKGGKSNSLPQENYRELLQDHVEFYRKLDAGGKMSFEKMVGAFLNDTNIEGVGIEITSLDKALIASSAVIPIFGFPEWRYKNLTNVILYPDTFNSEYQFEGGSRNIMGMVGSGYMNGQMLLSRSALIKGFSKQHGMENTAIHEFTHLLDGSDGATDGLPEKLLPHEYAAPWLHLMHVEMHKIAAGRSDIDPYALTNEAEFFAVASEYFFEKPEQLEAKHPELFQLMCRIFEQGPEAAHK